MLTLLCILFNFIGIVSSYMGLSLTVWITIQITYTFLAVYTPVLFKRLKEKRSSQNTLHLVSLFAGILSLVFPSCLTLGIGGYSTLDTKFPPVVCFVKRREISIYTFLIPAQILIALIVTELILIFHYLLRYYTLL